MNSRATLHQFAALSAPVEAAHRMERASYRWPRGPTQPEGTAMTDVYRLNNRAARLITAGELHDAEQLLDRVWSILEQRPRATLDGPDLSAAADEYFYRGHRLALAWHRHAYAEGLVHAQHAWELETGIIAAARRAKGDDLEPFAYSTGSWGLISMLTRLRRFDEAEQVFKLVLADEEAFAARLRRNREGAEKILLAGLCVYFESRDRHFLEGGQAVVSQAQGLTTAQDKELVYGYACYWATLGLAERATTELVSALRMGIDPERAFVDEDLQSLRQDPRFQALVIEQVLTWKIDSVPGGARVWIDENDTGLSTPARLRPLAPGRHGIRLTLPGYRDERHTHEQVNKAGLSLSLHLESEAVIAERQQMAIDSRTAPEASAQSRTRAFFGPTSSWAQARITVTRHTTYGLGECEVTLVGDGRATVTHTEFSETERVHEATTTLSRDEMGRLFEAIVEEAFTEMVFASSETGHPDELFFSMTLTTAEGHHHALSKFASTEHLRFDRLQSRVVSAVASHLDQRTRARLTLP
jgi:hypothetical protein